MKNKFTVSVISLLLLGMAFVTPQAKAEEGESVGNAFIEAFDKKDEAAMKNIIKTRASEVPAEVKAMVEYAVSPDAKPQEQDFLFNIAGTMAQMYSKQTGDDRLLAAVQQNYKTLLDKRKGGSVSKDVEEKTKKDLLALGKGNWRITVFKMDEKGSLDVEIDVKEASSGDELTPKITMDETVKAKDIVKKNLPSVKGGKIMWSSAGVGLKTAFIEQ